MNKMSWSIIVVLVLIILGGAYKFMIQGNVSESTDGRIAIHLTAVERDLILEEMRSFLVSVQQITKGISENNMKLVADNAKKVGKTTQREMPETLMGKLPMSFKKLGFATHVKFDQLALDAESLGDGNHALKQLTDLMQNCVSCHASHRLEIEEK